MTSRLTLPLFLIASGTSLFGNSAIAIVLPWLVLERTGDPAVAGLVAAVSAVPSVLAALVGGHLIDRVGRRRMAVLSDIGSAASVAGLALVDYAVGLDLTWFIVLGVAGALFDVPGMTARETLVANVARSSGVSLDKVAAARGSLFGLTFLAGPALAGGLLAVLPAIHVVWLTAACSAVAALTLALMPLPADVMTEPNSTGNEQDSPLAGWSVIRNSTPLVTLFAIGVGSMLLVAPLLSILLPAHFIRLGSASSLGISLSMYAIGTIAGSGLYGWLFAARRWSAWVWANIAYVVAAALIATLVGAWPVFTGMLVLGLGSGLVQPITTVALTENVPEAVRGRVFGAFMALGMIASPLGLGLMALLLTQVDLVVGARALVVGWIVVAIGSVAAPGLRDYIRQGAAAPATGATPDRITSWGDGPEPAEEDDADHRPAR